MFWMFASSRSWILMAGGYYRAGSRAVGEQP